MISPQDGNYLNQLVLSSYKPNFLLYIEGHLITKRFAFYEVNLGKFQIEYHGLKMQLCS